MGLWRVGIKFIRKGLYRADKKDWTRTDIMGLWRAGIRNLNLYHEK